MNLKLPPASRPSTAQHIVLDAINWKTYEKFLDAVGDRPIRLTYDRGRLEIMAPLFNQEWWKGRVGFVLRVLAAELGLEIQGAGSTTFRRPDLERGLEPDECFYIANASRMLGLRDLDLTRDPVPDLALEVDMTASSLDRMDIYAALGVPEVWRFENETIQIYRLREDGIYEPSERSLSFPTLPLAGLVEFLEQTQGLSESGLIKPFQAWVREHVLGSPQRPAGE